MQAPAVNTLACLSATLCQIFFTTQWSGHCPQWCNLLFLVENCSYFIVILKIHSNNQSQICFCFFYSLTKGGGGGGCGGCIPHDLVEYGSFGQIYCTFVLQYICVPWRQLYSFQQKLFTPTFILPLASWPLSTRQLKIKDDSAHYTWLCRRGVVYIPTHPPADEKGGLLKMNTALEYSTRVVQEGSGVLNR
jgi:hypothetical protein